MIFTIAGAAVSAAVIIFLGVNRKILAGAIVAIVVVIYAAGYLQPFVPTRYLIVAILDAIICTVVWNDRGNGRGHQCSFFFLVSSAVGMYFFGIFHPFLPAIGDTLFRYVVVYPLALYAGHLMWSTGRALTFARAYIAVSVISALLAMVEYTRGSLLFPRGTGLDELSRNGSQRAAVLAEHPLVLASLLLAAAPLAWWALRERRLLRVVTVLLLLGGIQATGSRGVVVCFAVWGLLVLSLGITTRAGARRARGTRMVACLACVGGIVWLAQFAPEFGTLTSVDEGTASAEYRVQLYSGLRLSLESEPLGWGVQGLPRGKYLLASPIGDNDLAESVDSEVAALGFEFGIPGVGLFIVLAMVMSAGDRLVSAAGQSAAMVTLSGLFLALHAWTGLSTLWLLLIGAASVTMNTRPTPQSAQEQEPARSLRREALPTPAGVGL